MTNQTLGKDNNLKVTTSVFEGGTYILLASTVAAATFLIILFTHRSKSSGRVSTLNSMELTNPFPSQRRTKISSSNKLQLESTTSVTSIRPATITSVPTHSREQNFSTGIERSLNPQSVMHNTKGTVPEQVSKKISHSTQPNKLKKRQKIKNGTRIQSKTSFRSAAS